MRTKKEYQESLELLAYNSEHWIAHYAQSKLPKNNIFDESDNAKLLLQELIDSLKDDENDA